MAKYIERDALIEWLKRIPLKDLSDGLGLCRVIMEDDFKKAIKKMPKGIIADVSPVRHGRWNDGDPYCPICRKDKFRGLDADVWADWKPDYCPNCGAKMDGGVRMTNEEAIKNMPKDIIVDAVPVSELEKLRDYLYSEDLIFMRGLAKLNKLIAKYGGTEAGKTPDKNTKP